MYLSPDFPNVNSARFYCLLFHTQPHTFFILNQESKLQARYAFTTILQTNKQIKRMDSGKGVLMKQV